MRIEKIKKHFTPEKCTEACTPKSVERLISTTGQHEHLVCKVCEKVLHTYRQQTYYEHIDACKPEEKRDDVAPTKLKQNSLTAKEFVREVVIFSSGTPLGDTALCNFVHAYESARPALISEVILSTFPKSAKGLKPYQQGVFDDVLKNIVDLIDTCTMFGVAVDGGVDHVKHEHILVIILYVLSKSFALPPLYHPTKAAWNGKVMAEEMMKALTSLLGELRVVKMRYFMVDGLRVNHVARLEAQGMLAEILEMLKPPGELDWENFTRFLCGGRMVCLPCTGHLVHEIIRTPCRCAGQLEIYRNAKEPGSGRLHCQFEHPRAGVTSGHANERRGLSKQTS